MICSNMFGVLRFRLGKPAQNNILYYVDLVETTYTYWSATLNDTYKKKSKKNEVRDKSEITCMRTEESVRLENRVDS